MEEFKYCRVCLVTEVRMYSLDITSNDSIGLVYSHLAQIWICDRNQHVCFECATLLHKYQLFKAKCLRAHDLLSQITLHSTEITKEVLQNIDRKENKLESNLIISPINIDYNEPTNDLDNKKPESTDIILKEDLKPNKIESEIKTETQSIERENEFDVIKESHEGYNKIESAVETISLNTSTSKKRKEPKTKKRKIETEVDALVNKSDSKFDISESFDVLNNDNDFTVYSDDSIHEKNPVLKIKSPKLKRKTSVRKEPKTRKRKMKTVIKSDDNLSDDEPLSKNATKAIDKIVEPIKKFGVDMEFFDDYATVVFLTPDEARQELLSRKESSNYKRSPFKCDFCYKGYEAKAAFGNHMKKHSEEYGDYDCDLCHLRFPKQIYLCKHKLSCHKRKFICKLCPYICYCMYQARTHVSLHKGKKYPCTHCNEIFSMPNSLIMHKHKKHLNELSLECVCDICGGIFGSARGLFLHKMKLHRTEKNSKLGPKCEDCGVHFTSEVAWKRHLVLSSKHATSNGCTYCGERFTSVEELRSHMRSHHPRVKRPRNEKYVPAACNICNKWLSTRCQYNDHMASEHPHSDEAKKIEENDFAFVCEVCGRAFKQQCFLTYHQRKHTGERPYKCEDCGKTFQMAGALSIHRTVHLRTRSHTCHLCNRVFSFQSALNKHVKTHLGIRPHKCAICDKGFLHMCELKQHIKYVHDKVPWPKKKSKRSIVDDSAPYPEYN